jgi:NTE family protein
MGADIVIGVNVSDEGLINAKELGTMTGILMQIAMTPSLKRVKEQIAMCDIYIKPDLKNYGTASFSNYEEILELGYKAGEENRDKFRQLAQSLNLKKKEVKGVSFKVQPVVISKIVLQGNSLVDEGLILGKLDIREGDTVTREKIEMGINKIFGVNLFKKVLYQIEKVPFEDKYVLYVKMKETQPATLKASVHYDNLFSAGIVLNLTIRELFGKSSRLILEGDISKNPKARISYLKYLGGREKFAGITGYSFLDEEIPSYSEGKVEDVSISRQHIFSAGLMTTQSLKQSIYAGFSYEMNIEKLKFANFFPAEIKNASFDYFKAKLIYTNNTTDNRNYPTKGREILFLGDLYLHNKYYITFNNPNDSVLGLSENELDKYFTKPMTPDVYGMAQFKYHEFIHFSNKFQMIPAASVGITISTKEEGIFDDYRIGGMQLVKIEDVSFMGLNFDEVSDQNYLVAGLYLQNVLFRNLFLKYGANFLVHHEYVPINDLNRFNLDNMFEENSVFGYGLKMTYKSPLGPINFGISRNANDPVWRTYFAVGFSFNYKD